MTTYREGQRVRIEWPDGTTVEGVLTPNIQVGRTTFMPYEVGCDGRTVTVLSEPRPAEPTGLGAVVEATLRDTDWTFVRVAEVDEAYRWRVVDSTDSLAQSFYRWDDLIDPVVLSEGWTRVTRTVEEILIAKFAL